MSNKSDDIYVRILKDAKEDLRANRPMSLDTFVAKFPTIKDKHRFFIDIYGPIQSSDAEHFMTLDAYMKLIDHEELAHSLAMSEKARHDARNAMFLAVGAIIVQVSLWIMDKYGFNPFN